MLKYRFRGEGHSPALIAGESFCQFRIQTSPFPTNQMPFYSEASFSLGILITGSFSPFCFATL